MVLIFDGKSEDVAHMSRQLEKKIYFTLIKQMPLTGRMACSLPQVRIVFSTI